MHVNTGTSAWHNNSSCCYFYSAMKVSVYTTQYRLDTSWVPARLSVHESSRLAHVRMPIGLHVHICVPCTHPKCIHCMRHIELTWGHQAQGHANKITGVLDLRTLWGVGMLFSVLYPQHSYPIGSLQLKAAGN